MTKNSDYFNISLKDLAYAYSIGDEQKSEEPLRVRDLRFLFQSFGSFVNNKDEFERVSLKDLEGVLNQQALSFLPIESLLLIPEAIKSSVHRFSQLQEIEYQRYFSQLKIQEIDIFIANTKINDIVISDLIDFVKEIKSISCYENMRLFKIEIFLVNTA